MTKKARHISAGNKTTVINLTLQYLPHVNLNFGNSRFKIFATRRTVSYGIEEIWGFGVVLEDFSALI